VKKQGVQVADRDATYYRALAARMLEQANKAKNEETRNRFLELAADWHELAEKIERGTREKDQ
jgi:hypothetical protein